MSTKQGAEEWLNGRVGASWRYEGGGVVTRGDAETYGDMRAQEERERIRKVVMPAARDIEEWVQLAIANRGRSSDPSHDPACATECEIERSRRIVRDVTLATKAEGGEG